MKKDKFYPEYLEHEAYMKYLELVTNPEKLERDLASKQSYEQTFDRAIYYTKTLDQSKKILKLFDTIKERNEEWDS